MKILQKKPKMPYGKFSGRVIEDLPTSYLKWIAENWDEKTEQGKLICKTADKEYQHRLQYEEEE